MNKQIPNTFGLNVRAKQVEIACEISQLQYLYDLAKAKNLPMLILGEGSNTLFTQDFNGLVVLNRIKGIEVSESSEDWFLRVGAGEVWHELVRYTIDHNLRGLENLALIPGCVGSAPIQNIGAYGVEFERFAQYVELLDLKTGNIVKITDGQYGYRESIFKTQYQDDFVVTYVGLRLPKIWHPILEYGELTRFDPKTVTARMIFDKVCEIRQSKLPDPKVLGNGGSFFKNPVIEQRLADSLIKQFPSMPIYKQTSGLVKVAAGWMIDQCGLKGFSINDAAVHHNQALVLVNKGHATPQDVVKLAQHVRLCVLDKFGILLSPEIRFMDANGEVDADTYLTQ